MDLAKPSPGVGLLLFAALKLELVSQVGIHPQTTSKERQAGGTEMSSKPSIPRLRSLPVCSSSQDARAWGSGRCFKLKGTIRNHASPIPFCPSHFQSFIQVLTSHLTKSKQHSFFEEPTEWTQAAGMSTWHDNSFETLICVLFFVFSLPHWPGLPLCSFDWGQPLFQVFVFKSVKLLRGIRLEGGKRNVLKSGEKRCSAPHTQAGAFLHP